MSAPGPRTTGLTTRRSVTREAEKNSEVIQSREVLWVMYRETRLKWGLADQHGKAPATDLTFSHLVYDIQANQGLR